MNKSKKFLIAQIGKTHGLHGDLKLHLHTDFPEQFKIGEIFNSSLGQLEISRINPKRATVAFKGYNDIDSAKKLTNAKIYSSIEETRQKCKLKDGEHFWFDLEGCSIIEDDTLLGVVTQVQRLSDTDYLYIQTSQELIKKENLPQNFLIPKIDRFILSVDTENKIIKTKDAKEILKAS
jgi:16S rRNA processing protein RimM